MILEEKVIQLLKEYERLSKKELKSSCIKLPTIMCRWRKRSKS